MDRLAHLVDSLNSSIALGRRIIEDLRPSTLSNLGLATTLEILAREFAERAGVRVHCEVQPVALEAERRTGGLPGRAGGDHQHQQVRQGAAGVDHAGRADGQAEVTVRDDGAGFDTTATPASAYGLMGMRFRVEAEGGSLTLQSTLAPARRCRCGCRRRPPSGLIPVRDQSSRSARLTQSGHRPLCA